MNAATAPVLLSTSTADSRMVSNEGGVLGRMPQLDGLRALAVIAVLWSHSMPDKYVYILNTHVGFAGVQLFFVLSGFLISGILLDISKPGASSQEKRFGLRQFYIRRFLRIFPLYYMVLLLAVLFSVPPLHDSWPWHAAYLSNFYFWGVGGMEGYGAHFWSLSVEEQFYLLWPMIILFMPRKLRLSSILILVCAAPMFRLTMELGNWGKNPNLAAWLMPANLDCLGVGALLAYTDRFPFIAPSRLAKVLLLFGLTGFVVIYMTGWGAVFKQTLYASFFGWLVWRASRGFEGRFGAFLQCRPVACLGKISYGVYLIHVFALEFWNWALYSAAVPGYRVFARLHVPPAVYTSGAITLLMVAAITIPVALASYRFYECPLNNLKRHFPYFKSGLSPTPIRLQSVG